MNEEFLARMQELLKTDYEAYLQTLQLPIHRGLRVNTLKCSPDQLKDWLDFELKPTQISDTVFQIDNDLSSLGNTIEHRQGLFYLQEVSATSAVEVLNPQPHEWVLDLCAAPGGKTTQIAMKMQNQGILFTNEIEADRAMLLLSNCERCGVSNAVITNSSPNQLKSVYAGLMDKILVDAPCSGEGMFKKESKALADWSVAHVEACAVRQRKILEDAIVMLKAGGILVYSTCTYAIEENEGVIDALLNAHPELELIETTNQFGRPGFDFGKVDGSKVRRIFPMDEGEGHFIAKLKKNNVSESAKISYVETKVNPIVQTFMQSQLTVCNYYLFEQQQKVFLCPFKPLQLNSIKVLRQGILCGELKKDRIEPHQHFYVTALLQGKYKKVLECTKTEMQAFLCGETLSHPFEKGYLALSYRQLNFAYGKSDGNIIKNHYPKGLRARSGGRT